MSSDPPPPDSATAELALSAAHFDALIERASDGIFVRRGADLVYVNPAMLALLGYDRAEELLGRSVLTFIHPEHHALLTERVQATDQGQGSEPPICVHCLRRDGRSVWLDGAGMPAKYQGKWAYLVLVRDVTARREEELALRVTLGARLDVKERELERARLSAQAEVELRQRAEAELRQAQKMDAVGRLAGGIAHDFNNLLSVILAHSSVLARSLEPEDPRQASAREVLAAGQRAADLTRQLLALSRRQVLEPRLVDVNDVVERMVSMLSRLVGEQIEIQPRLGRDAPATRIDPTQLEQVILNLVVNARDAMPGGGSIRIESGVERLDAPAAHRLGIAPGAYVVLCVSDVGIGMDEATQQRIFEPFFTTKEVGHGIGLGLATAQGIAQQSGGAIRAESAPGLGATFFVYLPAADGAPMGESRPLSPARTGDETIIVAEDDAAVRRVVVEVLSGAGYRVLAGGTCAEVLRAAASADAPIHLLVTDFVMPGMTGLELALGMTASHPELRVLILSGYSRHHQLPASMHFLPKPFTVDELLAKVRSVLDGSDLARVEPSTDPPSQGTP